VNGNGIADLALGFLDNDGISHLTHPLTRSKNTGGVFATVR